MPKYTADYLYNEFSQLAGMRTGSQYANDAGYWTGGRCNWGGSHNLREDCGTIARGFEKLESLDSKAIINELNKCTSQSEYESKKQDYIRQANEITSGLQARTGYSSSMFGVCIIWADQAMSPYVEAKMQDCRRELDHLKNQLGMEKYQYIEELRILKLEEKKIRERISELRREATKEKDPSKRAKLLLLIEEEGKKLEENLKKQQAIPTSKINFDPTKHVADMMEAIRRTLAGKDKNSNNNGGSGGPRKPRSPNDSNDPFGDDGSESNISPDGTGINRTSRKRNQPEQNNQQLILIAVAALVVIFLLMNQKESRSSRQTYEDYNYYD